MKEGLTKLEAENVTTKAELDLALNKVKFIDVDDILHARVELMEEFMSGQHTSWDPDQEIQTWKDKKAVLARGDEEEETDEDELTPIDDSPK